MKFSYSLILLSLLVSSSTLVWAYDDFPDINAEQDLYNHDIYADLHNEALLKFSKEIEDIDPFKEDPFDTEKRKENMYEGIEDQMNFEDEIDDMFEEQLDVKNEEKINENKVEIDEAKNTEKESNGDRVVENANDKEKLESTLPGSVEEIGDDEEKSKNALPEGVEEIVDDEEKSKNALPEGVEEIGDDEHQDKTENGIYTINTFIQEEITERITGEIEAEITNEPEYPEISEGIDSDRDSEEEPNSNGVDEKANTKFTDYFNESTVGQYFKEVFGKKGGETNEEEEDDDETKKNNHNDEYFEKLEEIKGAEESNLNYQLPKYFHFPIEY